MSRATHEVVVCPMTKDFCKHGHPRTAETTFERKIRLKTKTYIVRECRVCHAMRTNSSRTLKRFQSKSKYSELRTGAVAPPDSGFREAGPYPARGHMPFPGHRTVEEIWLDELHASMAA